MRFLNLLLSAAAATSVLAAPAQDTATTTTKQKRKSKFEFTGVNESGAEFGNTAIPGQLNKDYTWPAKSTIDVGDRLELSDALWMCLLTCAGTDVDGQGDEYVSYSDYDVGAQ